MFSFLLILHLDFDQLYKKRKRIFMVDGNTKRLSKLAREYNVGIHTIVEFLHKKGFKKLDRIQILSLCRSCATY